nr:MAG TPA: hypothetical protein [Bacteriophage sp.]
MDSNNEWSFLDILTIFSVVLQVAGYQNDMRQSTNDDLMSEIHKQNKDYLETIVQQQKEILSILEKSMSTEK